MIESALAFDTEFERLVQKARCKPLVAVIDQYEEVAALKTAIPTTFVEKLSLLDRSNPKPHPTIFIWLTTSKDFRQSLEEATSRNRRILTTRQFEIASLSKIDWPGIIEETFRFHNQDKTLADFQIIDVDLADIASSATTLGTAIENVGERLARYASQLQDLSEYQVIMLWPVTDGLRITRIQQFTDPRSGYKLNWDAWYRQLNADDQAQLPLREYNRARLYFDVRLIPIAAADLHPLCRDLDDANFKLGNSYLTQLKSTHFYSIVAGTWNPSAYAPLRERESKRADEAREWYSTVTTKPTLLGKRLAQCLEFLGLPSKYEQSIASRYNKLRADMLIDRSPSQPGKVIIEIKAFSPENTMPSTIASSVLVTLKRHAQFAGFLQRQ